VGSSMLWGGGRGEQNSSLGKRGEWRERVSREAMKVTKEGPLASGKQLPPPHPAAANLTSFPNNRLLARRT
jgi:hypothetical protein